MREAALSGSDFCCQTRTTRYPLAFVARSSSPVCHESNDQNVIGYSMLTLVRSKRGRVYLLLSRLVFLGVERRCWPFEMGEKVLAFANDRNWREVLFEHSNGLLGESSDGRRCSALIP